MQSSPLLGSGSSPSPHLRPGGGEMDQQPGLEWAGPAPGPKPGDGLCPVDRFQHVKYGVITQPDESGLIVESVNGIVPDHIEQKPATAGPSTSSPPFNRKKWVIIGGVVAAIIILAAVLGGVLGSVLPKKSGAPEEAEASAPAVSEPPSVPIGNLLSTSKLAVANRFDNQEHKMYDVYFQGPSGDLMVSTWNSSTSKWNVTSISGLLAKEGTAISIKNGTPISVDYPDFYSPSSDPKWGHGVVNLRYVNTANRTEYVVGYSWRHRSSSEYGDGDVPNVSPGSQIASVMAACPGSRGSSDCLDGSVVVYETVDQRLAFMYDKYGIRGWNKLFFFPDLPEEREVPEDGAALAITTLTPANSNATGPSALRLYVDISKRLREYQWEGPEHDLRIAGQGAWTLGKYLPSPSPILIRE